MIFLLIYVTVNILSVQVSSGHCWSYNTGKVNYSVTSVGDLNRRMLISARDYETICRCCCYFSGEAGASSSFAGTGADLLLIYLFIEQNSFPLLPFISQCLVCLRYFQQYSDLPNIIMALQSGYGYSFSLVALWVSLSGCRPADEPASTLCYPL